MVARATRGAQGGGYSPSADAGLRQGNPLITREKLRARPVLIPGSMSTRHTLGFAFLATSALLAVACGAPRVTDLGGGGSGNPTPEPTSTSQNATVTYYKDVLPLVQRECASCHTAGGAAFALDQYDAAKPYSQPMSAAIASKSMPPWPPDPACQHFQGERVLSDAERKIFSDWNSAGAPAGNPADAPASQAQTGNGLGTPDRVLDGGSDYTYNPAAQQDLYWCFRLNPGITTPTDFVAADVQPGNKEIVHHVIVFREANGQANAVGGAGFKCDGAPGEFLFAWVPGSAALKFPEGYGMKLQPNDRLLMQIHYHSVANAASNVDRTAAKIYFAQTPVQKLVHVSWLGSPSISIPANGDASSSGDCVVPNGGAEVLMTAPHMHTLATKFKATVRTAAGADACLIDIPKWDFGWQGGYMFPQPLQLKAGDTITSTCSWHNNTNQQVGFGEGTGQEMCFNFVYSVGTLPQYCFPGGNLFGIFAGGGMPAQ